jgi:hypothetical protein
MMPVQSLLNHQCNARPTATATATHPMEEALRKMKIMRVGIIESIRFKILSRKRLLSKRSFLAQSMERETHHGGTKRHKKMAIKVEKWEVMARNA